MLATALLRPSSMIKYELSLAKRTSLCSSSVRSLSTSKSKWHREHPSLLDFSRKPRNESENLQSVIQSQSLPQREHSPETLWGSVKTRVILSFGMTCFAISSSDEWFHTSLNSEGNQYRLVRVIGTLTGYFLNEHLDYESHVCSSNKDGINIHPARNALVLVTRHLRREHSQTAATCQLMLAGE
jgi:hypothetical protein